MAIGEVWTIVAPLVATLAGVVTGGLLTGRQFRQGEAEREARATRERLRIKVEIIYEELDAARFELAEQLIAVVNFESPGGAQGGRRTVPDDLSALHLAREAFYGVARKGHLYLPKGIQHAIHKTQSATLATALAESRAGQPFSPEADDPLRIRVATALDALTGVHTAIRRDLLGHEDA